MSEIKFSKEQQQAIDISNTNVLVSAAAGSGKTAVLTERIVKKLKNNVDINDLIVLTFTNASANDMKNKIIKAVSKEVDLKDQLSKINTANIMTFDAYALKLVKKYHYLLDLDSNIKIGEQTVFTIKKEEILNELFSTLKRDKNFVNFVNKYALYDLSVITKEIITLHLKMSNLLSLNQNYDEVEVNNVVNDFLLSVKDNQDAIINYLNVLDTYNTNSASDKIIKTVKEKTINIVNCNYDSLCENIKDIKNISKSASKKADNLEQINNVIALIKDEVDLLNSKSIYNSETNLYNIIEDNINDGKYILKLVMLFDEKIMEYKIKNNIFEFNDIKKFSIKLLEEYKYIADEIKNNTEEILLDEYQDTDDIQEYFVSLISNNNVFMVGDVKQSIYAFRNANPQIFIDKYNRYINNENGKLISLNKNFRSNNEVISSINTIFDKIMDKKIGGIDYNENERLVYSNLNYENQKNNIYDIELLNYNLRTSAVNDAYVIAMDIKSKINDKFEVVDGNGSRLISYKDVVILTRKKSDFEIYKKVFESLNVPLKVHGTKQFKSSYDIVVLKNLLKIITKFNVKGDFKHELMSVLNSFLFDYNSYEIEDVILNYDISNNIEFNLKNFNELSTKIKKLNNLAYNTSINAFVKLIVAEFEFIRYCNKLVDGENIIERLIKILQVASQFDDSNLDINDFILYLDNIYKNNFDGDIEFELVEEDEDVVQLMTIHKSKGLEFPLVYLAQLNSKFKFKNNIQPIFDFNKKYKIMPSFIDNNNRIEPFTSILSYESNMLNVISEEMRLFYVGLTRAESKLIFVSNFNNFGYITREKASRYIDFVNLCKDELSNYFVDVTIEEDEIEKTVNINLSYNEISKKTQNFNDYILDYEIKTMNRASKEVSTLFDAQTINSINRGNKLHDFLEAVDFRNPQYELLDEEQINIVKNLLNYDVINNNINMYHEYEFYDDNVHGIIDLLIERENEYVIVDYKTSNIEDEAYIKQLETYRTYLSKITDKEIRIALYSIMNNEMKFY